ncbi:hypothetical protein SSYM_0552, partial [Serratia symbiotica str. Tucson]
MAKRYGISELTVSKWKKRDGVEDHSHIPRRLQTTLSPAHEAVAVFLRKTLFLPLDDLLAVVREFLNLVVSRSGLDRCLRRHGVGNLREMKQEAPKPKQLPQSVLASKTPVQAMKDWYKIKPELFKKKPYYLPGC